MWKSTKEFFANHVMATAISVTLLYVGAIIVSHIVMICSPGIIADNTKLNILGDSVGGLTAPLALIWLIAAVVSQRQELNLTKGELAKTAAAMTKQVELMKEQSELQRAVASANVKSAWFAERFSLYGYFKSVTDTLYEGVTYEKMRDLSDHAKKVRFVFGTEVSTAGYEFFELVKSMTLNVDFYENVYGMFPPINEDGDTESSFSRDDEHDARTNEILGELRLIARHLIDGQIIKAMEAALELDEKVETSPRVK